MARKSGFLKRESKLKPQAFIDLIFYAVSGKTSSLQQIAKEASSEHSIVLSKQGLDNRFSETSVQFSKLLLEDVIANQLMSNQTFSTLDIFNQVKIKDSTKFNIDESFKDEFPGSGGSGSSAGVSIQFEYDFKSGKITDIDLQAEKCNDSKDASSKSEQIQRHDLIMRDLGYYSDKVIETIVKKEAFYLSRLCHSSNVFEKENSTEPIDFNKHYAKMKSAGILYQEMNVYLGLKKIPTRLVFSLLPENVYEKRVRTREKTNKKRKQQTTDKFKGRAHFNLFITNIPQEKITKEAICKLYRIRWQVELIFKTWKSLFKINKFQKMNRNRFLTTLYVNLMWIAVNWGIFYPFFKYQFIYKNQLTSIFKCMNTLVSFSIIIRQMMQLTKVQMGKTIRYIYEILSNGHKLEKRKDRCHFEEIITLLV